MLAAFAQKWKLRLARGARLKPQPLITLRPKYRDADVREARADVT